MIITWFQWCKPKQKMIYSFVFCASWWAIIQLSNHRDCRRSSVSPVAVSTTCCTKPHLNALYCIWCLVKKSLQTLLKYNHRTKTEVLVHLALTSAVIRPILILTSVGSTSITRSCVNKTCYYCSHRPFVWFCLSVNSTYTVLACSVHTFDVACTFMPQEEGAHWLRWLVLVTFALALGSAIPTNFQITSSHGRWVVNPGGFLHTWYSQQDQAHWFPATPVNFLPEVLSGETFPQIQAAALFQAV